jgi:hypothetical protein
MPRQSVNSMILRSLRNGKDCLYSLLYTSLIRNVHFDRSSFGLFDRNRFGECIIDDGGPQIPVVTF